MPIIMEKVQLGVFSRKVLVVMVVILLRISFPIKASAADPISAWQTLSTLNYNIANTASSVIENRLYVIAGSNYVGVNTVGFSEIDNNDILGPWNFSSQNVPNGPYWSSVVTDNNRIYKIGGTNYNTNGGIVDSIGDVHIGVPGIGGIIAGWTTGPSLPDGKRISMGAAVKVGNRIYMMGGGTWTNGGAPAVKSDIFVSTINPDGSLSAWSYANRTLPIPLLGQSAVESNGKIIVIGGGRNSSQTPTNLMFISEVDSLGNLGEWQTVTLPFYTRNAMVAKVNGYIVHAGGYAGGFLNKVYYSKLDSNGLPGAWTLSTNSLPGVNCCTAMAVWKNRVYIIGGHNGGYLNTIWSATVEPLVGLDVPDIKQYSPPWNDDVYDQASVWSNNPTIERWGCALTSATMVLRYYGHSVSPDGLNDWLKTQPDGYVGQGLINWLAISRYTRENDSDNSPTLEYVRLGSAVGNLDDELNANRPGILQEPGHFVVGKSKLAASYGINDPAFADRITLASYNNAFLSLGSYRESHTDLSYVMLTTNLGVDVALAGSSTFVDEPLKDDIGGTTAGKSIKTVLLAKPALGTYLVDVSGNPGVYGLGVYLYNNDGNPTIKQISGVLGSGETDQIELTIGTENRIDPKITFESLIKDLDALYKARLIKFFLYQSLRSNLMLQGRQTQEQKLNGALTFIKNQSPRFIDPAAASVLRFDINFLLENL